MKWLDKIKNNNFNYARNGRKFLIAPAIILALGIILFFIVGFNLGLDFTGGTLIKVNTSETTTKDTITAKMDSYNLKYTIAEEQGTSDGSSTFSIKFNVNETDDKTNEIIVELKDYFDDDWISAESVQAVTSNEKLMSVIWAVLAACVGLIIYMLFRFKITAGIATLFALAHDVLMICALMIIFQIEINTSFIAAVLTVISYSINNSLVVLDRVRSMEKNNPENYTLEQIVNKSVNRTLGRCILTVATTLATLLTLTVVSVIMNLPTLIQFALPIILGLIAGTYSSLFLIAPMYRQFETARILSKQRKKK